MGRWLRRTGALGLLAVLGLAGVSYWRGKNLGAVQRGQALAQRLGCFGCHGPGGLRGMANPGYGLDEIPSFAGGLITMYAQSEAEIREWIRDGLPKRVKADVEQTKLREKAVIRMPAFGDRVSERELRALVAFVKAASDFEKPKDENAEEGRKVAEKTGCFNCHGPQGRGSLENPGSLKGYIPSWDGADFPELAESDAEVREWIQDGACRRLRENPAARFFLERQVVKMPAYRGHLSDAELERLLDYIHWVRRNPY